MPFFILPGDAPIFVNIPAPDTEPLPEIPPLPTKTFEEIFEKDAQWLLGRALLAQIVRHYKERAPIALLERIDIHRMVLCLPPGPTVYDELSQSDVPISWAIPEELKPIYTERVDLMCLYRSRDKERIARQFLDQIADWRSVCRATGLLASYEAERRALGDPLDPELWVVMMRCFGLSFADLQLPKPFK